MTKGAGTAWRRRWLVGGGLVMAAVLSACSTAPSSYSPSNAGAGVVTESVITPTAIQSPQARSTLGTQWAEGRESRVRAVNAVRVTPDHPQDVQQMRYSDEQSIRNALGERADHQLSMLLARGDVEWRLTGDNGQTLRIYSDRASNYQLAGYNGMRYEMHFSNRSNRVYEVVTTVDGLDVMSGKPGSLRSSGYILRPGETVTIDGFRRSSQEVAAFRFSGKGNAYAANTPAGDARNIGVLGVALFETQLDEPVRRIDESGRSDGSRNAPNAFPADRNPYAPPPQYQR